MRNSALIVAIFASAHVALAAEVKFEQLFANPAKFNRKRVTITGIADSVGDNFWVWRDAAAYRHAEDKGAIFIVFDLPVTAIRSPYEYANAHFVKVTGAIDTSIHGHFGMDPFSLVLERVEVLPGPRLREFLPILGFFRNDTGRTINIRASQGSRGDYVYAQHFEPGTIACFAIGKGCLVATSLSGKHIVEGRLVPGRSNDVYYDRQKKAHYYQITPDGIKPVLPRNAKGWDSGYTGGRD